MNILRSIERHMRRHRISATRFGRDVARDPRLVSDLRKGREPGPAMVARIERWIEQGEAGPCE
jgi:hypothetical protein